MDQNLQSLIDRLNQAQNVLVTVSRNPSVDQLAAAIGLTLVLNHIGKHGTAVFSGQVPDTLEFLQPEHTLEKTTDSLRDFIIALDKSKADKLRYKVEDQVVRIFITPYRTSLSGDDLEFSQGDFNVDVVLCLGVNSQQDLDTAITAHGRILHDATVATLTLQPDNGNLSTINWVNPQASSLSEMVVGLANLLDKSALDAQTATALLTGIVAATERFSNNRTSPQTMSASAALMAAGANQQLIAIELAKPEVTAALEQPEPTAVPVEKNQTTEPAAPVKPVKKTEPGTLEIEHPEPVAPLAPPVDDNNATDTDAATDEPVADTTETTPVVVPPQVTVDANGQLIDVDDKNDSAADEPKISRIRGVAGDGTATEAKAPYELKRTRIEQPPAHTGQLTANSETEKYDPGTDELTLPPVEAPMLDHTQSVLPADDNATLSDIEAAVHSSHAPDQTPATPANTADDTVDDARSAVEAALAGLPPTPQPTQASGAQTVFDNAESLLPDDTVPALTDQPTTYQPAPFMQADPTMPPAATPSVDPGNTGFNEATPGSSPADQTLDMPLPGQFTPLAPGNPFPGVPQSTSPAPSTPFSPPPSPFGAPQAPGQALANPFPPLPGAQVPQSNGPANPASPPPVPPPMFPQ